MVANDFSAAAVASIQRNIEHNEVKDKVEASHGDAAMVMYMNRELDKRFTVVDLDPYGSATPFLDAAVQSVADGGLMAVTCTDLAVLCGAHSEACYAKYGSMSLRGKHCHEQALRIVLSSMETHANRYKRHIAPLLSVHMDFYVRMFVRVYTSAAAVKHSASKQSTFYQCSGCGAYELQPLGKVICLMAARAGMVVHLGCLACCCGRAFWQLFWGAFCRLLRRGRPAPWLNVSHSAMVGWQPLCQWWLAAAWQGVYKPQDPNP